MKRSFVIAIHIGFWLAYFSLLFFIIVAATQGFSKGPNLGYIIKIGIPVAVLPSFCTFYLFYFLLFPKYIQTRKIGLSFLYGFLISIISALVGSLLSLLFGAKMLLASGYGLFFSMALIGLFAGVAPSLAIRRHTRTMAVARARVTTCPLCFASTSDELEQTEYGDSFVAHSVVKGYDLRLGT